MTLDMTVKFAEGSDTIIEGWGVPFGVDLDGQQFTAKTERFHEWFPNGGRPILYHHGFNKDIGFKAVGHELSTEPKEQGDWVRGELDKADAYYEKVAALVRAGKVGWSSAAPDHKVKIAADGTIERWPVIEYSLTPTPAFPNHVAFAMKSAQADELLASAGIEIPDLAADIEQSTGDAEPESLAEHSDAVLAGVKAWAERLDEKVDFRMTWKERDAERPNSEKARKSGRILSSANLNAINEVIRLLTDVRDRATAPSKEEQEAEAAKKSLELTLAITG